MTANAPLLLGTLGLIAAYVVMAWLLVSVSAWSAIRWWIKGAGVAVTLLFFWASFYSMAGVLGWPTEAPLPDRFELIGAVIEEPDPKTRAPGAIFLWLVELPGEGPLTEVEIYNPMLFNTAIDPHQMPRAYKIPYDREVHRQVYDAKLKMEENIRQVGVRNPPSEDEGAPSYAFYDRPEPLLPPQSF